MTTILAQLGQVFVSFLDASNLSQVITFPTQVSSNTIDLLTTSNPQNIIYVDPKEPFAPTCDHKMIEFKVHQTFSKNVTTSNKKNVYRGNYNDINKFLSGVDWISVSNCSILIN